MQSCDLRSLFEIKAFECALVVFAHTFSLCCLEEIVEMHFPENLAK